MVGSIVEVVPLALWLAVRWVGMPDGTLLPVPGAEGFKIEKHFEISRFLVGLHLYGDTGVDTRQRLGGRFWPIQGGPCRQMSVFGSLPMVPTHRHKFLGLVKI